MTHRHTAIMLLPELIFENQIKGVRTMTIQRVGVAESAANSRSFLINEARKTQELSREDLVLIEAPDPTETFQPIKHSELIDCLADALALRNFQIRRTDFAVSLDGMKLFGLLEIDAGASDFRFAIGVRNSNDKTMRMGMVAGYRVVVCDNMMFAGDFKSLLAKHTKGFDLIESVAIGIDRIHRGFEPLMHSVNVKKTQILSDESAKMLIYEAFMGKGFPVSLMKKVDRNYFSSPYAEFKERSLWSLENAFTESFKELKPINRFQATAKLGRFLEPLST